MARVEFDGIWKRFPDGTEAIKDMNLEIHDGEFLIFVGPSGCGKSTALRMVAGLEEITEGKMLIGEQVVNDLSPKERDIAMVFQSYALYPHMTVFDNMGFALKLAKVPKAEIERRVKEAADILDLSEYLHRKPKALSGGQRQRVAMGRAIVRQPQAFLMDEPLSNLDAKLRVAMRAEIAQLQDRLGVTTIYVTHDQVEAMTMGDRVAVLKRGVLQQVEAPQTLYERPDNLFVAGFIGSPSMNIAEASISRDNGRMTVRLGSTILDVPAEALAAYPGLVDYVDKPVAVGLRPEDFHRADGTAPAGSRVKADVCLVEALGSEIVIHFDTDAHPIISEDMREAIDDADAFAELERTAAKGLRFTAKLEPGVIPRIGEVLDLHFNARKLHFFDRDTGTALR
jgi:multiple sugar transport system ATP-binding protein